MTPNYRFGSFENATRLFKNVTTAALIVGRQLLERVARLLSFAPPRLAECRRGILAVQKNRFGQRTRAIVMHPRTSAADAPQFRRQEDGRWNRSDASAVLHLRERRIERSHRQRVGQLPAHVVAFEIAVQTDGRAARRGSFEAWLDGILQQIESHRPLRVVVGILAGQEVVDVVAAATKIRLFEHGLREMHFRNVTACTADLREQLSTFFDPRSRGRLGGGHEAKRRQSSKFSRRRLCRVVDRHRGDVAHRELSRHAVAVGIRAGLVSEAPDELLALHAEGKDRRSGRKIADGGDVSLPAERSDDEIRRHASNFRRIEADLALGVGCGDDRADSRRRSP